MEICRLLIYQETPGLVTIGDIAHSKVEPGIVKMPEKFVMLPANARKRRQEVEKRMARLRVFVEGFPGNRIEWGDRKRGFITAGVSYLYVKEVFPKASVLKLGSAYPLPEKMIREIARNVEEVFIVEELDPLVSSFTSRQWASPAGERTLFLLPVN